MRVINLIIFPLAFSLFSCTSAIKDYSNNEELSDISGKCYKLKYDSFLMRSINSDIEPIIPEIPIYTIQAFGGENQYGKSYPASWNEYINDRDEWDYIIFRKTIFNRCLLCDFPESRTLMAHIPKDSKIIINKIYSYPVIYRDYVWIVRANLLEEERKNYEIELLSSYHKISPQWVEKKNEKLIINDKYLSKC